MRLTQGVAVFSVVTLILFLLINGLTDAPTGTSVTMAIVAGVISEWVFYKFVRKKD